MNLFDQEIIKFDVQTGLFPSRSDDLADALIDYLIDHKGLVHVARKHGLSKQTLHNCASRYRLYCQAQQKRFLMMDRKLGSSK